MLSWLFVVKESSRIEGDGEREFLWLFVKKVPIWGILGVFGKKKKLSDGSDKMI